MTQCHMWSLQSPLRKVFRGSSPATEWSSNSLTQDSGSSTISLVTDFAGLVFCLLPTLTPPVLAASHLAEFPGCSRPKVLRWDLLREACSWTLPPQISCQHPCHLFGTWLIQLGRPCFPLHHHNYNLEELGRRNSLHICLSLASTTVTYTV